MNKILLAFSVIVICLPACNKDVQKPLSKEEIQLQVDSIAKMRMLEVEEQARIELEHRIKIEVKIKADSLLQVMLHEHAADSLPHNVPTPNQ